MYNINFIKPHLWNKNRKLTFEYYHLRPYIELFSPLKLSYFNIYSQNYENNHYIISSLCEYLSIPRPNKEDRRYSFMYQDKFLLKWESHREFCTFEFIRNDSLNKSNIFENNNLLYVPNKWINSLDGKVLNCINLHVTNLENSYINENYIFDNFNNNYIVGSDISKLKGSVYSDFKIQNNGAQNILLINGGPNGKLSSHLLGRTVQRLLDIESYRSMNMITYNNCNSINNELDLINEKLFDNEYNENIEDQFNQIRYINNELNKLNMENRFRFQASKSYTPIIDQKIKELSFSKIDGLLAYDLFLNNKLEPCFRSISNTEQRLNETISYSEKNLLLIKTNIDLETNNYNSETLKNMDKKKDIQIKLQKTVEGLSTIILTYYSVNLFNYMIKGFNTLDIYKLDNDLAASILILPIAYYFYRKNKHL